MMATATAPATDNKTEIRNPEISRGVYQLCHALPSPNDLVASGNLDYLPPWKDYQKCLPFSQRIERSREACPPRPMARRRRGATTRNGTSAGLWYSWRLAWRFG